MDRVSLTDPIWRVTATQEDPIPVTRLNGAVVWVNTSAAAEANDPILPPEDEARINEATINSQSELRSELETAFGGSEWPQPSAIIEPFRRYAIKIFDVNAIASRSLILTQVKDSSEVLRSMVHNLLADVFGLEWERSPGEQVVRTYWQHGRTGWKGKEIAVVAGNDPDPNCLYDRLMADAIRYRYRFHAQLPGAIPGQPPGINVSNLEWWRYIGLNERHNLAMAIKPYLEDRIAHWQSVYATSASSDRRNAEEISWGVSDVRGNHDLSIPDHWRGKSGNPIIERVAFKIFSALKMSDHYAEVRIEFNALLFQILTFCSDRLDAGAVEAGKRADYRFRADAREWDLQADLREWLVGNFRHGEVRTEVTGIGTGRADIYVSFGGTRFVIELKKEEVDASPSGLRKYLPQASAYQSTNVRLGFLGVLDLTHHRKPAPHLEENVWVEEVQLDSDAPTRHIVVFRVTGNLSRPSAVR